MIQRRLTFLIEHIFFLISAIATYSHWLEKKNYLEGDWLGREVIVLRGAGNKPTYRDLEFALVLWQKWYNFVFWILIVYTFFKILKKYYFIFFGVQSRPSAVHDVINVADKQGMSRYFPFYFSLFPVHVKYSNWLKYQPEQMAGARPREKPRTKHNEREKNENEKSTSIHNSALMFHT